MTTPAVSKDVLTTDSLTYTYGYEWPLGAPMYWERTQTAGQKVSRITRKRPESVVNAVREDGTRKPSNWDHLWWFHSLVPGPLSYASRYRNESRWSRVQSAAEVSCQLDRLGFSRYWLYGSGTSGHFPIGVEQAARTAVLNKMRSSDFQLGVTLAEAGKTVSLLRHTAETIVGGISSFRGLARMSARDFRRFIGEMRRGPRPFHYNPVKRRKSGPWDRLLRDERRMSREIPERWLEYTYGWKPLIADVDNAGQALAKLIFDDGVPMDLWARAGAEDVSDETIRFPNFRADGYFQVELINRITSQCHYSIRYRAAQGVPADARDTLGLGLASTLWELTPYSFALDWVVGVGDWLGSFGVGDIADFVEGSVTKVQRIANLGIDPVETDTANRVLSMDRFPRKIVLAGGRMERRTLSQLPVPAFVPPIRNKLGLPQLASLMSLLVQSGAKPYNRT